MICEKCKNEHDGSFGSGRFCSRKCANSRTLTAEIKEKISESLNGNIPSNKLGPDVISICKHCNNEFSHRPYDMRIFCSFDCAQKGKSKSPGYLKNLSKSTKLAYEKGKPVYGGKAKWIEVETSNGIIKVQGSYEERACKILDHWKSIGKILDWEYTNDRYQYLWEDGTEHTYLLDFKVINQYDFYYIETKGYIRENDERKWDAIRSLGIYLDIWFEEDLKREEEFIR